MWAAFRVCSPHPQLCRHPTVPYHLPISSGSSATYMTFNTLKVLTSARVLSYSLTAGYVTASSIALLVYHFAITFSDEVSYLLSQSLSILTYAAQIELYWVL